MLSERISINIMRENIKLDKCEQEIIEVIGLVSLELGPLNFVGGAFFSK